jgi:hypothetical protein
VDPYQYFYFTATQPRYAAEHFSRPKSAKISAAIVPRTHTLLRGRHMIYHQAPQ